MISTYPNNGLDLMNNSDPRALNNICFWRDSELRHVCRDVSGTKNGAKTASNITVTTDGTSSCFVCSTVTQFAFVSTALLHASCEACCGQQCGHLFLCCRAVILVPHSRDICGASELSCTCTRPHQASFLSESLLQTLMP